MKDYKNIILNEIDDLTAKFLYYDRKEDEILKIGDIEKAIKNEEITISEICDHIYFNIQDRVDKS